MFEKILKKLMAKGFKVGTYELLKNEKGMFVNDIKTDSKQLPQLFDMVGSNHFKISVTEKAEVTITDIENQKIIKL